MSDLISRKAVLEMERCGFIWGDDVRNMPAAPTWISVEERLPDDYERVLVWRSHINDVDVFDGRSVQIRCETAEMRRIHGITHWMPLPEPPKEERHE